jgi:hypothetical protein
MLATVIQSVVRTHPEILQHLEGKAYMEARRALAIKAAGDMGTIQATYHDAITEALTSYFEGGSLVGSRNAFRKAAVEALGDAFDTGYQDGGADGPPEGDALDWLNARVDQEFGYIGTLYEQAKQIKKDPEADYFSWVTDRADGYTSTVQALYNAGVLWAKKNQMLTWHLGETEKHCTTCAKLDGKSHRASWYISHDYIPRKPGSAMECHGYNCDCSLTDKNGDEVTI